MTTALALYAALVSTLAIGWQVVSWRLSRRTLLQVNISRHIFRRENKAGRVVLVEDNLIVSVINYSEHPVRVSKARLANNMMFEGELGVEWLFGVNPADPNVPVLDLADQIAGVIEARDSVEAIVPVESLREKGIQPWIPLEVYVLTPTNAWFSSDPHAWVEEESAPPAVEKPAPARSRPQAASKPPARVTRRVKPRRATRSRKPPPPAQ